MYYQRLQENSSIREKIILCCLFRLDYKNRALVNQFELSGPETHAPLGSRTGLCELVLYFSVLAGAVRVFGDFVVLVRCGPLFFNFLVSGAVRVSLSG